ncbi:MAG: HTH-type transcriptional repressor CytR [Verrucomicrobia bacterium ADurb.Bin345]|nr:MAG: HTH-type transcriptional repressor CytR [Verrucomicrobia bacterium ADurb.Bin345]
MAHQDQSVMRPTIQDLALELGVHKATVSRALSGKPGVSDMVRRKVIETAQTRGFFPHGLARSLATSVTETIGLVCCDETSEFLTNPFYSQVLAGIADETARHGLSLAFCSHPLPRPGKRQSIPKIMRERRADGFLFVGDQDDLLIRYAHHLGYPVVLVDHHLPTATFDTVVINNTGGAELAVHFLADLGHQRIGFVGGSLQSPSFAERLEGYRRALAERGLPADPMLVQAGEDGSGYCNMLKLLAMPYPPTAVLACNDVHAAAALRAVREAGRRVPDDISLVGFDDSTRATETWPPLTTLSVDAEEMGRAGVKRLVTRLREPHVAPGRLVVHPRLTIRGSCSPRQTKLELSAHSG